MTNPTYKQIGRNCLADFIGADAHVAAEMAEILAGFDAFAGACEDGDFEGGNGGERTYWTIAGFLPHVALAIRTLGWLSKGKAYERDGHTEGATATIAWNNMIEVSAKLSKGEKVPEGMMPTEKDVEVANKTIEAIAAKFENVDVLALSDYENNLKVSFGAAVVEGKTAGIIASGINFIARDEEAKAERVDFTNSQYVGEIGKRAIFTIKCIFAANGGGRPVVFVDAAGNKVSAWNPGFNVEKGATYTVKATPVKQDEYKAIKSTMLNRMVLATEKDLAPKAVRKPRAKKVVEVVNA